MSRGVATKRRRRSARRGARLALAAALALATLTAIPGAAAGRTVRVPVTLDAPFLRRLLVEQVFTEERGTARVEAEDGCSDLVLSEPSVDLVEGRVRVAAKARASLGVGLGSACWVVLDGDGELEVDEAPILEAERPVVRFHVVDSHLHTGRGWLAESLWDWIKPAVQPRFETLQVDLAPPLAEVRDVLPLFLGAAEAPTLQRLLDSLAVDSVEIQAHALVVTLRFDVPDTASAGAAGGPEPPLSPDENAAFEAKTRAWDAFLTFVVKHAGRDTPDAALRRALLGVLLDARHELVAALQAPPARGKDPVRRLFLRTWERLAPLLREVDLDLPAESGLHYVAFIAAGDALGALDQAGPALGLEISSDGLRRLARALAPARPEDPLEFATTVDFDLRALFGFDEALPAPRPAALKAEEGEGPVEEPPSRPAEPGKEPRSPPEGVPLPETPQEPSRPPERSPAPNLPPGPEGSLLPGGPPLPFHARLWHLLGGLGRRLAASLGAASAHAASLSTREKLAERLEGWLPTSADLGDYVSAAGKLLRLTAEEVRTSSGLPAPRAKLFRDLVLAAAWQESCWRQYVRRGKRFVPLRSRAGDVGLMQVNERVWRGFYTVAGLRWDAGYNARAGGEILSHYLRDFALAKEGRGSSLSDDELARSTYAMYNGGPSDLDRWRNPRTPRSLRSIDRAFYEKLRAVRAKGDEAVTRCYGD